MTRAPVTAIIPTLCLPERQASLARAIDSLLSQRDAAVRPLLLVNGRRFDPAQLDALRRRPELRVHTIAEPSVTAAQRAGRELVQTEFFCFLDDDDEYLPGAIAARLEPLQADGGVDVLVSNGYRTVGGRRVPYIEDLAGVSAEPLRSLVVANWMASCGGMFRTSRVGLEYFSAPMPHHEWTYLAFRLALTRRIAFAPEMTFVLHETTGSASRTIEHGMATADVVQKILELDLDPPLRKLVRRKYGAALHACAEHHRKAGRRTEAWTCHLGSLRQPGGLTRYGLYTRKLLWGNAGASGDRVKLTG